MKRRKKRVIRGMKRRRFRWRIKRWRKKRRI
jgi:hypothetical protein